MNKGPQMAKSKGGKGTPPHKEHNAPGGPDNPFGQKPDKAALLVRLAEAARAKDKTKDDAPAWNATGNATGETAGEKPAD